LHSAPEWPAFDRPPVVNLTPVLYGFDVR